MKVLLDSDEMYPVMYVSEHWGVECDIPDSVIKEHQEAKDTWLIYQDILGKYYVDALKAEKLKKAQEGIQSKGFNN